MRLVLTLGGESVAVDVTERDGRYEVRLGEERVEVDARIPASGPVSLLVDGESWLVDLAVAEGEVVVVIAGQPERVQVEAAGGAGGRRGGRAGGGRGQRLLAPMPGRVVAVHVRPGDRVEAGTPLVVLEAMKMENEFRATAEGRVSEVAVAPGQAVNAGDVLVVVSPDGGAAS